MSRLAYVNGRFVRHAEAGLSIDDRSVQFADSVYEVWSIFDRHLGDLKGHLDRLERSLAALGIPMPVSRLSLCTLMGELIRRNHIIDGLLYLQITRGVAPRDHAWPTAMSPGLILTAKPIDVQAAELKAQKGIRAITCPDDRWGRCDIKSTSLLPNILAKHKAREMGANEAIFIDRDGFVSEGSSTNVYRVDDRGVIYTRPLHTNILAGITRCGLIELIHDSEYHIEEMKFTYDQLMSSSEVFISAASSLVLPVIEIDHKAIGGGQPGPVALRLRSLYLQHVRATASVFA